MTTAKMKRSSVTPFRFSSYGVVIEITSNEQEIVEKAAEVARKALLDEVSEAPSAKIDHLFQLIHPSPRVFKLFQNGEEIAKSYSEWKFWKFFDAMVRISVAEYAADRVFLHSGAVAWKGKGIIMPGDSFHGKSTLVSELVKLGADYYSDDFAILDAEGKLHSFARPLAMRTERTREGKFRNFDLTLEQLGGKKGEKAVPVRLVLLTKYVPDAHWHPTMLSPGQGVLGIFPFVLPIRRNPEFSMKVLHKVCSRAIIASGPRGSAREFAETLLNFVDNNVD